MEEGEFSPKEIIETSRKSEVYGMATLEYLLSKIRAAAHRGMDKRNVPQASELNEKGQRVVPEKEVKFNDET